MQEIIYTIALSLLKNIGLPTTKILYETMGSATAVFENRKNITDALPDASPKLIKALNDLDFYIKRAEQELEFADKRNIRPLCLNNDAYPKRLKEKLPEISHLLLSPPDDIVDRLTDILAESGIKLLFTEPLSGVPIKGATRWIYGNPCIQLLSERQEYENFRFTVLHEIGHILLHGKKDIFLEEAGFKPDDDLAYERKEKEADAFARKMMTV